MPGFYAMLSEYKNKIGAVVQRMFHDVEEVLPENRSFVDEYLMKESTMAIELFAELTDVIGGVQRIRGGDQGVVIVAVGQA